MAESEQQPRVGGDSLAPKNSGGAAAPAAGGSAPIAPPRRGHTEWIGLGRPNALREMPEGGSADAVEAVEEEAAALAGQVADLWWGAHKNAARAGIRDALAERLARIGAPAAEWDAAARRSDEWASPEARRADAAAAVGDAAAAAWDKAARLARCHQAGDLELFASGELRSRAEYRCKQRRLCPWCAREEAGRRMRRLRPLLAAANPKRLQFCTLTMANIPVGELAAGEAAFWAAWDKLRRRRAWAEGVLGSQVVLEQTWNSRTQSHHVHAHVALLANDVWRGGFSWAKVQADWQALTGAPVVDFRPLDGVGGLLEVTKYATKIGACRKRPSRKVRRLAAALRGRKGSARGTRRNPASRANARRLAARIVARMPGGGLLDMPLEALAEWVSVFCRPKHKLWRGYGAWAKLTRADSAQEKAERRAALAARDEEAGAPLARFAWDGAHPGALAMFLDPALLSSGSGVRYIHPYISTDSVLAQVAAAIDKHREALRAEALARQRRRARRAAEARKRKKRRKEARKAAAAAAAGAA